MGGEVINVREGTTRSTSTLRSHRITWQYSHKLCIGAHLTTWPSQTVYGSTAHACADKSCTRRCTQGLCGVADTRLTDNVANLAEHRLVLEYIVNLAKLASIKRDPLQVVEEIMSEI